MENRDGRGNRVGVPRAEPEAEPRYLTVREFARRVRVHEETVRVWCRDGLPVLRVGRGVRVRVREAEAWLDARAEQKRAASRGCVVVTCWRVQ